MTYIDEFAVTLGEARRAHALASALKHNGPYASAVQLIADAKEFEAYLKGEGDASPPE